MRGSNVLLIAPPISSLHFPSMALSQLKADLIDAGAGCDVRYLTFPLLEKLGLEVFQAVADPSCYYAQVGEWLFSHLIEPGGGDENLSYLWNFLQADFPEYCTAKRMAALIAARQAAEEFLDECIDDVPWHQYRIVGFTSSFQQNAAALALARRVKALHPDIVTVLGGANCQGAMGIELHRRYAFLDAVCLGEGDRAFPTFVTRVLAGADPCGIAGMATRLGAEVDVSSDMTDPVADLNTLPFPDFVDFYDQHSRSALATQYFPPVAIFESSRGCWWGAKHHCTFCGLNGSTMTFRSKSPARVYDELQYFSGLYGSDFVNCDNILDMRYLKELFPRIASEGPKLTMFFEVKSNLKADHLKTLSAAGVKKIQPGIETLSSEILALMQKGCSKLQNIQILKLAAEAGIYVEWNFLYGFPKERDEHYAAISKLIPRLYHLQAPGGWGRVRADRFSPYFSTPEQFGIEIKPARAYSHIYGDDATSIAQLAYHFDIFSDELLATSSRVAPVVDLCRTWRENESAQLYCEEAGERLIIFDTRSSADAETTILTGIDAAIYRLGWKITPVQELLRGLGPIFGRAAVLESVASLARRELLVEEAGNVLTLALRQPGFRRAPSWEEIRADRLVPFLLRPMGMPATPAPMRLAQLVTESSYHV